MWYVFESRSFNTSSNLPIIHFTYMYVVSRIMHMINGLVLIKVTFDTFSLNINS